MGIGIHGQWLYIDPDADLVIAKFSSQPEPVKHSIDHLNLAAFAALSRGHIQGIWDRRDLKKNLHQALLTMGGHNLYYR